MSSDLGHGAPPDTLLLTPDNLQRWRSDRAQSDLEVFSYDRQQVRTGIVHIGVGAFHRAHMGSYIDRLLDLGEADDWGICGVGLLPHDAKMVADLAEQANLYTVMTRQAGGTQARIVGAMTQYLHAPSNPTAVLDKLSDPTTKIVSLTITESGYFVHEASGRLDIMHPDIASDLGRPLTPKTLYGYLATALQRRRQAGHPPFTVMSCDNVQHNGNLTRRMLLDFAREFDHGLMTWLEEHGAFPNSMVDRITPRTTDDDRLRLTNHFGISDRWPVVTEPYSQWVLEDQFACGRPALERVGVQLAQDVTPFETMKLRLLNGSHSAMAYLGYLMGFEYVHEVIGDARCRRYIDQLMHLEVLPRLPHVPGIDLELYCRTLIARFDNPAIADQVTRLCFDGSGKLPKFILPSIEAQAEINGPMRRLVLCVAAWMRYLRGEDERGQPFEVSDPMAGQLQPLARQSGDDPSMLLAVGGLFSDRLRHNETFAREVGLALKSLNERGAAETLAGYLE